MAQAQAWQSLVTEITGDNEQPVPKEALEELIAVATGGPDEARRDLAVLLVQRLQEPTIAVKLKALRVIMVLGARGGADFAVQLRDNAAPVMQEHTQFEADPDPVHGDKPQKYVQAAAAKCLQVGRHPSYCSAPVPPVLRHVDVVATCRPSKRK
jgi:hypothetical protein